MGAIEFEGVGKTYPGGVEAVKDVSLSIGDGRFVVLVGPSGCGKSTLLRMVAGLETITEGRVSIAGRAVNALEPADRDIAMVFQNYALYPHMSVRRNLEYGLRNRKVAKAEIARRVDEAARILELSPLLDRRPRALSGGQRQRVAMGRAIVREPAAFLFDEPLSNLDAKLRVQMRAEIRQLQRRLETTSLYVTHDQLEAMTLADTLVALNHGRIEQAGTPMELYERPASLFVATFIGSPAMNLVRLGEGETEDGGEETAPTVAASGEAPAAGIAGLDRLPGDTPRDAVLGLRPEHMRLLGEGEAAGADQMTLAFTVEAVEIVGAESYVIGRLPGQADSLSVRVPGQTRQEPGMRAVAAIPLGSVHRFEAASGRRLA